MAPPRVHLGRRIRWLSLPLVALVLLIFGHTLHAAYGNLHTSRDPHANSGVVDVAHPSVAHPSMGREMPTNHRSSTSHELALEACAVAVIALIGATGGAGTARRHTPLVATYDGRLRISPEVPPPRFQAAF